MNNDRDKKQSMKTGQAAINREIGLEQYEGDTKIYADILVKFTKNNQSAFEQLKGAICDGDLELAYRTAHSLRGAAGTIGATRLASAALDVEKMLSPKNSAMANIADGKALNEPLVLLESEFCAVFDDLKELTEENEGNRYHRSDMDRNKMIELMNKLTPFLETGDTRCLEHLDEIHEVFFSAAEGFKLFVTCIEQYDFEQADEIMESIRRFIRP